MVQQRRKFQGVLNILSFNRHYYVFGIAVLILLCASRWVLHWPPVLFWIIVGAFLYGLVMPLIISAYVYDFSGYYDLHWMKGLIDTRQSAALIVNITAGFDETSYLIKESFPDADLLALDFYNRERHTEPAIRRARKVSPGYPDTRQ